MNSDRQVWKYELKPNVRERMRAADVRHSLERAFELLEKVAEKNEAEGQPDVAAGIRKAVRIMDWQLIGDGRGCVITLADPRRDDPKFEAMIAILAEGGDDEQ